MGQLECTLSLPSVLQFTIRNTCEEEVKKNKTETQQRHLCHTQQLQYCCVLFGTTPTHVEISAPRCKFTALKYTNRGMRVGTQASV